MPLRFVLQLWQLDVKKIGLAPKGPNLPMDVECHTFSTLQSLTPPLYLLCNDEVVQVEILIIPRVSGAAGCKFHPQGLLSQHLAPLDTSSRSLGSITSLCQPGSS